MREAHWGRGAKPLSRESERGSRGRGRSSRLGSVGGSVGGSPVCVGVNVGVV